VATTSQVVAPGSGFGHGRVIPVHRFLEARFEEPSTVGLPPISRAVELAGHILCRPILGGLHHQYLRI
jgi:hypothetical protein